MSAKGNPVLDELNTAAEPETVGGEANPRRIYAYTIPGKSTRAWTRTVGSSVTLGEGVLKIGDTTRASARERIKEQLGTAFPDLKGVDILFDEAATRRAGGTFRDHDVHRALRAAGINRDAGEWYECTLEEVRAAVASLRSGVRFDSARTLDFGMRPEQEDAVAKTAGYFRARAAGSHAPHFLWNAKMRFGKTFTAYQLAREMEWTRVLVLTYKPAVHAAWREDLSGHVDFEGWRFVDRDTPLDEMGLLTTGQEPLVWFASLQDLLGRTGDGHMKARNALISDVDWDCIVIDEYHFGAWRSSARDLYDPSERSAAELEEPAESVTEEDLGLRARNYLYLSGTPFRAMTNGEFSEEQIFNWTYINEQESKRDWDVSLGPNPYADLPGIEMYTYSLGPEAERYAAEGEFDGFSLNEFFKAHRSGVGKQAEYIFDDPTQVSEFLKLLRGKLSDQLKVQVLDGEKPPFPYEDVKFAAGVRHAVWFMPDVASCRAMKGLLQSDSFFNDYVIHVAAGTTAGQGAAAKPPVERAIRLSEQDGRRGSITLTCGKLMTGVTVKHWSSIFMLRSLKSPESYFQAGFRVQSPWSEIVDGLPSKILKNVCYIFEFDPNRALSLVAEYATRMAGDLQTAPVDAVGDLLNYLPIYSFSGGSMRPLDAVELLNIAASGVGSSALARRWNSPLLVDISESSLSKLLANRQLLDSLERLEDFRNLSVDATAIITHTKNIKSVRRKTGVAPPPSDPERQENARLRKELRAKLQKFLARVPVFMYLTDFREEALVDVIRSLDPELFTRVTGLTISDFDMLNEAGLFNARHMDAAIWAFRQFELASLSYASSNGPAEPRSVGRWAVAAKSELESSIEPSEAEN